MDAYEYDITHFSIQDLGSSGFVCSEDGICGGTEKPSPGELAAPLRDLLNRSGHEGWRLIQLEFGKGGVLAFWMREKQS